MNSDTASELGERRHVTDGRGIRGVERRHLVLLLTRDPERLAARHHELEPGRGRQEPRDQPGRTHQLLEVVEDDERHAVREVLLEAGFRVGAAPVDELQALRDGRRHELGFRDGFQRHPPCPIREPRLTAPGQLERETGLARTAGARERQQPVGAQERGQLLDLPRPAHEGGERLRQVTGTDRPAQRVELRGQPSDDQQRQPLGGLEVLEGVLTQVEPGQPLARGLAGERTRHRGHDHLAAVSGGPDACRAVDVDTHEAATHQRRLPGVDAHPDRDPVVVRPGLGRKGALGDGRGKHGIPGAREGHEERIALGALLGAAGGRERITQQLAVALPHDRVARRAEPLLETRRALDVGEQERKGRRSADAPIRRRPDGLVERGPMGPIRLGPRLHVGRS